MASGLGDADVARIAATLAKWQKLPTKRKTAAVRVS